MFHYGTDLYSPCAVHRALVSLGALYPSGTNGVLLLAPLPAILAYSRGGTRAFFSSRRFYAIKQPYYLWYCIYYRQL
nr:MAG TPA: hypothetical protein [Caudoviricetes sp.]